MPFQEFIPWLQSLGFALAHSLWQMALLGLIFSSVIRVLRPDAAARFMWAAGLVFAGTLTFVATWIAIRYGWMPGLLRLTADNLVTADSIGRLAHYVSIAYLVAAGYHFWKLLHGHWGASRMCSVKQTIKAPAAWRAFVRDYAAYMGISRPVQLRLHAGSQLFTIGFWKPLILLPAAAVTRLSPAQLEAVLLHELAHIRRSDYLVNIMLSVCEALLFFNPFARKLIDVARAEREKACDDFVIRMRYPVPDYAHALLALATMTPLQHSAVLNAQGSGGFQLHQRIERMLLGDVAQRTAVVSPKNLFAAIALFGISLSLWFRVPVRTAESTHQSVDATGLLASLRPGPAYFYRSTLEPPYPPAEPVATLSAATALPHAPNPPKSPAGPERASAPGFDEDAIAVAPVAEIPLYLSRLDEQSPVIRPATLLARYEALMRNQATTDASALAKAEELKLALTYMREADLAKLESDLARAETEWRRLYGGIPVWNQSAANAGGTEDENAGQQGNVTILRQPGYDLKVETPRSQEKVIRLEGQPGLETSKQLIGEAIQGISRHLNAATVALEWTDAGLQLRITGADSLNQPMQPKPSASPGKRVSGKIITL